MELHLYSAYMPSWHGHDNFTSHVISAVSTKCISFRDAMPRNLVDRYDVSANPAIFIVVYTIYVHNETAVYHLADEKL
jgi:hypothetical protein